MNANGFHQVELNFSCPEEGYNSWLRMRGEAEKHLRRKVGLPIGREVEIWLRGDIRLQGKLRLKEEAIFIPEHNEASLRLCIGQADFTIAEIESCLALD